MATYRLSQKNKLPILTAYTLKEIISKVDGKENVLYKNGRPWAFEFEGLFFCGKQDKDGNVYYQIENIEDKFTNESMLLAPSNGKDNDWVIISRGHIEVLYDIDSL